MEWGARQIVIGGRASWPRPEVWPPLPPPEVQGRSVASYSIVRAVTICEWKEDVSGGIGFVGGRVSMTEWLCFRCCNLVAKERPTICISVPVERSDVERCERCNANRVLDRMNAIFGDPED